MDNRLKEIRENIEHLKSYINHEAGRKYAEQHVIPDLLDALEQAQATEHGLRSAINSMRSDYTTLRSEIEESQDRERVLREALETTCGAVEDLMVIGSEYGTSGYQVIVDEAREALKQEDANG